MAAPAKGRWTAALVIAGLALLALASSVVLVFATQWGKWSKPERTSPIEQLHRRLLVTATDFGPGPWPDEALVVKKGKNWSFKYRNDPPAARMRIGWSDSSSTSRSRP